MKHLSSEAQQAIVEKALNRKNQSLTEIAESHNIGYSTLQRWIKQHRDGKQTHSNKPVSSKANISLADRFQHLLATSHLDELAQGAYCREHGLYSFQLKQWREEFMAQNKAQKSPKASEELKTLRAENKRLKQDLRRKDSALAETTALLVLKKKANLIWGKEEDV